MSGQVSRGRHRCWLWGLLVCVLCLAAGEGRAVADGFRCPKTGELVGTGDTAKEIEARCGSPTTREDLVESYCDESGQTCGVYQSGERWTYDFGPYDLIKILTFRAGVLRSVAHGGYGKHRKR